MSELFNGRESNLNEEEILQELYEKITSDPIHDNNVGLLIALADKGHVQALADAEEFAKKSIDEIYPDQILTRDIRWHHQFAIAETAGAVARLKGFEPAIELASLIDESLPTADALIQIGEAGYPAAFGLSLSHMYALHPGTKTEYLRRIAESLVQNGNVDELESLRNKLKEGFKYSYEPDYDELIVKAMLVNGDTEMAHAKVDELSEDNPWVASKVLLEMAQNGDKQALAKVITLSRSQGDHWTLLEAISLIE